MLRRTYFLMDDVASHISHQFAGELLAIREFNETNKDVKIDRRRGLRPDRIFPDSYWVDKMYVAHDLAAISTVVLERSSDQLALTSPESNTCTLSGQQYGPSR